MGLAGNVGHVEVVVARHLAGEGVGQLVAPGLSPGRQVIGHQDALGLEDVVAVAVVHQEPAATDRQRRDVVELEIRRPDELGRDLSGVRVDDHGAVALPVLLVDLRDDVQVASMEQRVVALEAHAVGRRAEVPGDLAGRQLQGPQLACARGEGLLDQVDQFAILVHRDQRAVGVAEVEAERRLPEFGAGRAVDGVQLGGVAAFEVEHGAVRGHRGRRRPAVVPLPELPELLTGGGVVGREAGAGARGVERAVVDRRRPRDHEEVTVVAAQAPAALEVADGVRRDQPLATSVAGVDRVGAEVEPVASGNRSGGEDQSEDEGERDGVLSHGDLLATGSAPAPSLRTQQLGCQRRRPCGDAT